MVEPRIELVRTNGIFSIDGDDFEVENKIWVRGDHHEVLVIDAAHSADRARPLTRPRRRGRHVGPPSR